MGMKKQSHVVLVHVLTKYFEQSLSLRVGFYQIYHFYHLFHCLVQLLTKFCSRQTLSVNDTVDSHHIRIVIFQKLSTPLCRPIIVGAPFAAVDTRLVIEI